MIKPVQNKIIVRVNQDQKNEAVIGGKVLSMAREYGANYREKSPVLAELVEGGEPGTILLCHHNMFQGEFCPYWLRDDLYSIPFKPETVFVSIDKNGDPQTIGGNIACERVMIESTLALPAEMQMPYLDRVRILSAGHGFKGGELAFVITMSMYHIHYTLDGIDRQICKVYKDDILGFVM